MVVICKDTAYVEIDGIQLHHMTHRRIHIEFMSSVLVQSECSNAF